jgi:hypothetical protein
MAAKHLKGVYNLNPTAMIMKQGSEVGRAERQRKGPTRMDQAAKHPGDSRPDAETVGCTECGDVNHPAMQTRHSHPSHSRIADGRTHEDQHYAVKQLKG